MILALVGVGAFADDSKQGLEILEKIGWFTKSAPIQDLRERSTQMFELIDENQSGSITLDEIDFTQMETDMAKMNPDELRQNSQRIRAIQNKFMIWSEEVEEFEVVDTNNDGVWNKEEYEARSENMNLHRLELGIQTWDIDGNGAVELHEFNRHLDELELLDEDGDGLVSREEALKSENKDVISDVLRQQLKFDNSMIFMGAGGLDSLPGEALKSGTRLMIRTSTETEEN